MIPYDVIRTKNAKKVRKGAGYLVVLSVGAMFGLSHYLHLIEMDIQDLKRQMNDTELVKKQITETNTEIKKLIEIQGVTSNDSFPYHRFLYTTSAILPEDMRIVSISNSNDTENKEEQNKVEENTPISETTKEPVATSSDTSQEIVPKEGETEAINDVPSPVPTDTSKSSESTGEITQTEGTEPTTPKESEAPTFEASTIYIKGYNLYPDSIATFADELRTASYIRSVKVTRIDNYNLGFSNLKFFEIEVKGK